MARLKMSSFFSARSSLLASVALLVLVPGAQAFGTGPAGEGYAITVPEPAATYPLPLADNYRNQTGKNEKGEAVRAYDDRDNPIIEILTGFNRIWTLGDEKWADGGANGDGPADFSHVKIVDPTVWQENMRYVLSVTGENRTRAAAFEAYMNDRRSQGYSVIDGMGPLAAWYREGAGATTTINHTLTDFDPNEVITRKEDDKGTEAGAADSELKDFVAFMKVIRGPEGTTSPAKYFYSSPRPWRMNDKGEVIETGKETIGDRSFESHDSDPGVIVPALKYARENRGRGKDGGFPSGHTNAAYLAAIAYAYAVPERFSELLTAASELGESRIVAGMHSPLDVIGGRITATAMAAAMLQDPKNAEVKKAARAALQAYFTKRLPQGQSLIDFAHGAKPDVDQFADATKNGADYRRRMTYSFSRDRAAGDAPMVVPKGAEVLLETRLPYLDAAQRRAVLFSTGIEAGYPLLDDSNGWGRINLVAAASGYGAFDGDVEVTMDAAAGGFNAADRWTNDIAGAGRLVKSGSGALTLGGHNSYGGGTILREGTLVASSADALGTGGVLVSGGTLSLGGETDLVIGGDYTQSGGTLAVDPQKAALRIKGNAVLDGATLKLAFDGDAPATGTRFDVISANGLTGTFATIDAGNVKLRPVYTGSALSVVVE
ncbi:MULTISPECIES: phosphatase PAP2 family protein [Agrobacterium]|uniref:phosphatase PAP2 family protein n=1 Tax=Agrobacterium TaxID=357 RepID=UPI00080FAE31|nr:MULTISPECIES: phosphatase PAP2 family protein [Agrobacterium]MCZ7501783.1 phosphatase PAP2 family protein [Rhizobium rhizogenes]NTB05171.1 phosphatase PAP2 family protein [Agrobacterium tumefaciens]OCJ66827.1 serine protease [Agrobacterium tumefaciens]